MQSMVFIMHDQGPTLTVLAASQHGCTMNTTDCIYCKLPADNEWLIYSKHVEDIYWNKLRKKVHLVGSYYTHFPCSFKIVDDILEFEWHITGKTQFNSEYLNCDYYYYNI